VAPEWDELAGVTDGVVPQYWHRVLGGRMAARPNELLVEIAGEHVWVFVAREVMPDHGHVLVGVSPVEWPAEVACKLKGCPSRVLRAEFGWLARRQVLWSKSYFVASVGYVSDATVRRYIQRQWDALA
jgi:putative transposase